MNLKIKIKNMISAYNPLAVRRRKKMRTRLHNKDFSLLCPNCLGGMLLHDLNMSFNSPMVNLMLNQKDFIKFVCDLDYYLNHELKFYKDASFSCPCARIGDDNKSITIHFTHYEEVEQARLAWERRAKRINKDNLFIVLIERDGIGKEDIERLKGLKCRGIVVFTANEYPAIPYVCQIKRYQDVGYVENILRRSFIDDSKEYEHYFDFVSWFNQASGEPYSIKSFIL